MSEDEGDMEVFDVRIVVGGDAAILNEGNATSKG